MNPGDDEGGKLIGPQASRRDGSPTQETAPAAGTRNNILHPVRHGGLGYLNSIRRGFPRSGVRPDGRLERVQVRPTRTTEPIWLAARPRPR